MISKMLILNLLFFSNAFANYKIGIYTDQTTHEKAQGLINYIKNNPPFDQFDIDFTIQDMPTADLNCHAINGIERLIGCDNIKIISIASKAGIDQAFAVSNNPNYGGSGGSVPVITTSSDTPYSMLVHEYMHTLGFADEYSYDTSETQYYCDVNKQFANLVRITPLAKGYTGDQDARQEHSGQIPWYGEILLTTPIATNTLGTPKGEKNIIGLFEAETCINAPTKIYEWKPGQTKTIMRDLNEPLNELTPILQAILLSLGFTLKQPTTIPQASVVLPVPNDSCTIKLDNLPMPKAQEKIIMELIHKLPKLPK
jgi:hypothetical protein